MAKMTIKMPSIFAGIFVSVTNVTEQRIYRQQQMMLTIAIAI